MKKTDLNIDTNIIIKTLKNHIPNLKAIYIFGSYANGTATLNSDIDIAFLSDKKIDNIDRWNISNQLANILKKDVDLVDLKSANTIFKFQIVAKGIRIYGSGYEVEEFEMLTFSFYIRFKEERKIIEDSIIKG